MARSEHFDVVIVGAGTAGCVLATRLTEDPARRVLLLEAGGKPPRLLTSVPGLAPFLRHRRTDWALRTVPQAGLGGRRLHVPRGRMIGGSGAMNTLVQIRGHARDFDDWAAAGCTGWSADDLRPYFERATRAPDADGVGQVVAMPADVPPVWRAWIEAGVARGLPHNRDFNGPEMDGVGLYPVTVHRGRRHHTAAAYLDSARGRPGLTVRTGAEVRTLTAEGGRITGLEYVRDGQPHRVAADTCILAAGAIASPHILLRSGIGPADALREAGITAHHDLPGVGANLHDHLMVPLVWKSPKPTNNNRLGNGLVLWDLLRAPFGRGPLSVPSPACGGFTRLGPDADRPDVQWHVTNGWMTDIDDETPPPKTAGFTVLPGLVRPHSRGSLALDPADPFGPPRIDPAALSDPRDGALLAEAVALSRRIVESAPFDGLRGEPIQPERWSDDTAGRLDYIRRKVITIYHPVGTCRMGIDADAVVDPKLCVRGVQGLRVIDASIMPTITCGNTNGPTVAIAEKGAALVLAG